MSEEDGVQRRRPSPLRGLSPGRSLRRLEGKIKSLLRKKSSTDIYFQPWAVTRTSSIRPGEALAPLHEGPDVSGEFDCDSSSSSSASSSSSTRRQGSFRHWMMGQIEKTTLPLLGYKHSDVRLLLGVLGAPLAPLAATPFHRLSPRDGPIEATSAHYILQQYIAASGGIKFLTSIQNMYVTGKMRMCLSEFETANKVLRTRNPFKPADCGCFVLWQMKPDMWYVELVVSGSKVYAGCDGKLVWRHNPWMGPHAAKGPIRPLRRSLQGLDPLTTASMFWNARCVGEKVIKGEECFVLKVSADPYTLGARSDGPAEIIRHVLFGYFSQRTGFLVGIEDSHLTRIQSTSSDVVYWETGIETRVEDYRNVDGIAIAHCGRSAVTLFRFGEVAMGHTRTRMEEEWSIDEVALNVAGLCEDCFIPPADIHRTSSGKQQHNHHDVINKKSSRSIYHSKEMMLTKKKTSAAVAHAPVDDDDDVADSDIAVADADVDVADDDV